MSFYYKEKTKIIVKKIKYSEKCKIDAPGNDVIANPKVAIRNATN